MIGQEQRVKIELRNPGSGDATGVMLLRKRAAKRQARGRPGARIRNRHAQAPAKPANWIWFSTAEKAGKMVNVLTARADGNLQVQQQVEFEVIAPALTVAVRRSGTTIPRTAGDVRSQRREPRHRRRARCADRHQAAQGPAVRQGEQHGRIRRDVARRLLEPGRAAGGRAGHGRAGGDADRNRPANAGSRKPRGAGTDRQDTAANSDRRPGRDHVRSQRLWKTRSKSAAKRATKFASSTKAPRRPPTCRSRSTCRRPQVRSAEGESQHKIRAKPASSSSRWANWPRRPTRCTASAPKALQAGDQRIIVQVNTDDLDQPIRREESTRVFGDQ